MFDAHQSYIQLIVKWLRGKESSEGGFSVGDGWSTDIVDVRIFYASLWLEIELQIQ